MGATAPWMPTIPGKPAPQVYQGKYVQHDNNRDSA
jgi:hypothetical protein